MGRANNERPRYSFKAQQIFRSVTDIHHRSFNILILICKSFSSQVVMLDMGGSMLGYLNSNFQLNLHCFLINNNNLIEQQSCALR